MPTIGSEIRAARKRKRLTCAEVCIMTDMRMTTYQRMEQGCNPHLDDLLRVVSFLGVPLGSVIRHPDREGVWKGTVPKV